MQSHSASSARGTISQSEPQNTSANSHLIKKQSKDAVSIKTGANLIVETPSNIANSYKRQLSTSNLEKENHDLRKQVGALSDQMKTLESRFTSLQSLFFSQISDLRQENIELKAYVKAKLS